MDERTYSVSGLADASGVTVRTLHHYDEIGLLRPSSRNAAGYRQYSTDDARRLADVLAYRACGVPLSQIAELLDGDQVDRAAILRHQLALLDEQVAERQRQREILLAELSALEKGEIVDPTERFEAFGDFDPAEYEAEAAERWGETDAYRESQRRVAGYTADDWTRERAELAAVESELAACLDAGLPAGSDRAKSAAEAHRLHIDAWFYPCSYEMHTGLADMYVADERFAQHYDSVRPGLAAYTREAIWANAVDRAS